MAEVGERPLLPFAAMPDETVVAHAKQGSQSATQHLLQKYRNLVEGKARSYFLVGADHEDVIQEGMIGLFKAIRDFSDENLSAFKSFAELCITRQIITAIKTATRQKHSLLNSSLSLDMPIDGKGDERAVKDTLEAGKPQNPVSVARGKQFCKEILQYIKEDLSELEAEALLNYLRGKSYRTIAHELGCSVKQIDNALQRAKKKMERKLQRARNQQHATSG